MVFWKKKKREKEKKEEDEEDETGVGVEGKGYSTNGNYGIKTLADPSDAKIDIVFIHGLTGNRDSTWQDKKSGTMWPQDLLPGDMPKARVVTFGYDADVVGLIDVASSNTIRDHGKALATQVAQKRLLDGSKDRPLIFVVHGLGGLVCEQALLVSRGAAESWMNALLESTAGITFLGTPHSGSNLADWASILANFSGLVRPTNKALVSVLQPGSEMLANLQQEFHTMLNALQTQGRPVPRIYCFFEELPYNGAVGLIVPRHSAILSRYGNQGVHANQVGMTRFADRMDQGYQNVCNQLRIWALEIESDARPRHVQQLSSEELDFRRGNRSEDVKRIEGPSHVYSGPVSSYGGQVIQ